MVQDLYVQVNNLSTTEVWGFSQKNMPNVVGVIKCPLNNGNFDNPKSYSVHFEFVIYVLQTGIQSVWIWRSNWATALETRVCLGHHRVFSPFMPNWARAWHVDNLIWKSIRWQCGGVAIDRTKPTYEMDIFRRFSENNQLQLMSHECYEFPSNKIANWCMIRQVISNMHACVDFAPISL